MKEKNKILLILYVNIFKETLKEINVKNMKIIVVRKNIFLIYLERKYKRPK